jgi:hypothetical protein
MGVILVLSIVLDVGWKRAQGSRPVPPATRAEGAVKAAVPAEGA